MIVGFMAWEMVEVGIMVSGRGSREVVAKGLDLAAIMQAAAKAVGGQGGGHHVAAGATIPPGTEQTFLEIADRMVREQLHASGAATHAPDTPA